MRILQFNYRTLIIAAVAAVIAVLVPARTRYVAAMPMAAAAPAELVAASVSPLPSVAPSTPAVRETHVRGESQFRSDVRHRLPELRQLFIEASADTGIDWTLLAAVGYQESHWQADAASTKGALGVMMLTTGAAAAVGVIDRADLRQNILGGARYLAQVRDTIPERISEPDRTLLALAAYNVGYGHLEDARVLTQLMGKNPDSWQDVREQLPLLAEQQWYSRVKRGFARGSESAQYVEQVRRYHRLLTAGDGGNHG